MAHPIAQSKPSVDHNPGAHVVITISEQGSMETEGGTILWNHVL